MRKWMLPLLSLVLAVTILTQPAKAHAVPDQEAGNHRPSQNGTGFRRCQGQGIYLYRGGKETKDRNISIKHKMVYFIEKTKV